MPFVWLIFDCRVDFIYRDRRHRLEMSVKYPAKSAAFGYRMQNNNERKTTTVIPFSILNLNSDYGKNLSGWASFWGRYVSMT
jgi:hypothetical protein